MVPIQIRTVALLQSLRSWALLHQHLLSQSNHQLTIQYRQLLEALADCQVEIAWTKASAKQRAFAEVFFAREFEGKHKNTFAAIGGNRSGKTIAGGWICFALYLRECAKNGDEFWCVCQNLQRSISGQQKELWQALPRYMFGGDQAWDEKIGFGGHRKIKLQTKDGGTCVVEFRSADQDINTFEQAKLRGVWCDEKLPEDVFARLLRRIIDLDGFILYTDVRQQWWQEERLFGAKPDAGVFCRQFKMWDNAHNLPPGAIEQAMAGMTEDEKKMAVEGENIAMEGIVYKEFQPRHVIEPFAIPDYWPRWRLIDYGSSAATACLWVAISEDEQAFVYREHFDEGHSCGHNARLILEKSGARVMENLPTRYVEIEDSTPSDYPGIKSDGGEEYVATFMDPHCIDTPPAVYGMAPTVAKQYAMSGIKAKGWPYIQTMGEHACVQRVKFKLEKDRLHVFATCTNLIREFASWKHKCDKDGKPLASDAYENANNHGLDCLKGFFATNPCFTPQKIEVVT